MAAIAVRLAVKFVGSGNSICSRCSPCAFGVALPLPDARQSNGRQTIVARRNSANKAGTSLEGMGPAQSQSSAPVVVHKVDANDDDISSVGRKPKFGPGSWDGVVPWKRSSMLAPLELPEDGEALDQFIMDEIRAFAPMEPRPLSMKEILEMMEPRRIAKFLHVEVPVRFAERIRWIEDIPDWQQVPELLEVHSRHVQAFRELRLVRRRPTLDDFTAVVKSVVDSQKNVQHDLALAMHRLHMERGDDYGSQFADKWLDNVLLNCIGTEMLMNQYLACVALEHTDQYVGRSRVFSAGIIDPDCDVAQICRDAAEKVQQICEEHTGRCPLIKVEVFAERGEPRISYIPGFLTFILTEILKNSCLATVALVKSDREVSKRPISIIVCADDQHVAIRISDRAGGIPFKVGPHVWSYLYSTTGKGVSYGEKATSLAGYGVGLPLSRLYARYLGGSLDLVSLPGYGTSVDLFLTRINSEQVEAVPDADIGSSLGDVYGILR